jgi:hypothetical protein
MMLPLHLLTTRIGHVLQFGGLVWRALIGLPMMILCF